MNRLSSRLLALLVSIPCVSWAQESSTQSAAEATIRKGVDAYVDAFNSHNAKRVAEMWSPDAVYVNRITGEEVVGRDAIAKQFETLFASQKDAKINVSVESVRLLSPNVAVEQGKEKFILTQEEKEEKE